MQVPKVLTEALDNAGMAVEDVDWLLLHQVRALRVHVSVLCWIVLTRLPVYGITADHPRSKAGGNDQWRLFGSACVHGTGSTRTGRFDQELPLLGFSRHTTYTNVVGCCRLAGPAAKLCIFLVHVISPVPDALVCGWVGLSP